MTSNEYYRQWRKEHPEKVKQYKKTFAESHPDYWKNRQPSEESKERQKQWKLDHPEITAKHKAKYARKARQDCISHYGGRCECCGETHIEFLTIDHPNGGGNKHRKEIGVTAGFPFYRWIIKNNYPEGLRVLCLNCNFSLGRFGYCPHQKP